MLFFNLQQAWRAGSASRVFAEPLAILKAWKGSEALTGWRKPAHKQANKRYQIKRICLKTVHTPAPGYFKYL